MSKILRVRYLGMLSFHVSSLLQIREILIIGIIVEIIHVGGPSGSSHPSHHLLHCCELLIATLLIATSGVFWRGACFC